MRAFHFPLQAALKLRQLRQEQAEAACLAALERVRQIETLVGEAEADRLDALAVLLRVEQEGTSGAAIARHRVPIGLLRRRAETLAAELVEARATAERLRGEWAQARVEAESVLRLRQKQYAAYLDGRRREEDRRLDEIAVVLHTRRRRAGNRARGGTR